MDKDELMALADVMATYGHTRSWWFERRDAGLLKAYYIPGDRRMFFARSEIEAYLTPKEWPRPETSEAKGTA